MSAARIRGVQFPTRGLVVNESGLCRRRQSDDREAVNWTWSRRRLQFGEINHERSCEKSNFKLGVCVSGVRAVDRPRGMLGQFGQQPAAERVSQIDVFGRAGDVRNFGIGSSEYPP